ncbi:MAG TPA: hypothetical protein PK280_18265 [Planctomycetota bacterium]|nr:hypothetical protein [Planctomycetota bacterium]
MELLRKLSAGVEVRLSQDELVIINNAINEALEALDQSEFGTRMGASVSEAQALLSQLGAMIGRT